MKENNDKRSVEPEVLEGEEGDKPDGDDGDAGGEADTDDNDVGNAWQYKDDPSLSINERVQANLDFFEDSGIEVGQLTMFCERKCVMSPFAEQKNDWQKVAHMVWMLAYDVSVCIIDPARSIHMH